MKIAVPTRNNYVDGHFGQCELYTIFTISRENKVEKKEILPSPHGCGCKSNIASVLAGLGVNTMLAGNMGQGALNVISVAGIKVYRGCSGDVDTLIENYLKGSVADSGETCDHHEHHGHHDEHRCEN